MGDTLLDEYEYQYYYQSSPSELDRFGKSEIHTRWCNNELHYIFESGYSKKDEVREGLDKFNNEFKGCFQIM